MNSNLGPISKHNIETLRYVYFNEIPTTNIKLLSQNQRLVLILSSWSKVFDETAAHKSRDDE